MTEKLVWKENVFSKEYERSLRNTRGIPLMVFLGVFLFSLFYANNLKGYLIGFCIAFFGAIYTMFGLNAGLKNLPTKIAVSEKGIYFIKRNMKKGFIPWEKVYRIGPMDSRHPNDYLLLYRGRDDKIIKAYDWFGYTELALGYEAAQEVMKKYEEYKRKEAMKDGE